MCVCVCVHWNCTPKQLFCSFFCMAAMRAAKFNLPVCFESESRLQLPQWLLVLLCSRGRFEEAQHLFSHENGQLCLG